MTPRQESRRLLGAFTHDAVAITLLNERHGPRLAKGGPRGVSRRAHKRRRRALSAALQRVSWCSFGEVHKTAPKVGGLPGCRTRKRKRRRIATAKRLRVTT